MPTLDDAPRVELSEVLATHDVVGVSSEPDHEYIVVTPKGLADTTQKLRPVDLRELGSAMPSPWTSFVRSEYNQELRGINGLRIYDQMRRNDGTVRGTLRLVKTPVLAADWMMKPASQSAKDKNIADFVWRNLTKWQSTTWPQFLTESLLCLDFGYYMFEKVFARGEDVTNDPKARGKIVWKKFAPRHPMDVKEWHFDENGGPSEVVFYNAEGVTVMQDGVITQAAPLIQDFTLPMEKVLLFSFDKEGGNVEGISVLRSAYKHWYYKDGLYKIDAIQKERHGIGVPIIQLPNGFNDDDKRLADQIGRNLRTNERAHIVLPPMWEISFAKLEGQPVDALASANHHDSQIHANIMAGFMDSSTVTKEEDQAMFLKGTRFIADVIVGAINKYAIPQLVDYNWARTGSGYPELVARRIGEQADWRTLSFAVRNYVGAGIIIPDQPLEDELRDEMGLPPADQATARVVSAPQGPGASGPSQTAPAQEGPAQKKKPSSGPGSEPGQPTPPKPAPAGPPRQAPPKATLPRGNAGIDKSGKS